MDTFTYEIIVADTVTPAIYNLTGIIVDDNRIPHTVLGDTQITVAIPPGVTVSSTDLAVGEGSTDTYTVVLNTQPTDDVTVTVNDPTDNTDVTASPREPDVLHNRLGYGADGHGFGGRGRRRLGGHGHRDAHR